MIKLWMAGWLRKLAQRLDGDLYLPVSPRLKATAEALRSQWESDENAEGVSVRQDLLLYGNAYTLNGKRVPPEDVVVHQNPYGPDNPPPYRDHQGRSCNCMMPGEPLTSSTKHLPMCPLYKPAPKLRDPFRHGERPAG